MCHGYPRWSAIKSYTGCLILINLKSHYLITKKTLSINLFTSYAGNIQYKQPINKLCVNQDKLHNCAWQANIEDKILDAKAVPRSDKFKLGSFPRGVSAIQSSTCTFTISLCTLVRWGVANALGFGYILWFILAVRPHPKRVLPFVCTDTRLGRCDLLLFDFRSYIMHSVEWGLLRTRGRQQILKYPQWHLLLQKGTSNKLEGNIWNRIG